MIADDKQRIPIHFEQWKVLIFQKFPKDFSTEVVKVKHFLLLPFIFLELTRRNCFLVGHPRNASERVTSRSGSCQNSHNLGTYTWHDISDIISSTKESRVSLTCLHRTTLLDAESNWQSFPTNESGWHHVFMVMISNIYLNTKEELPLAILPYGHILLFMHCFNIMT